MRTIHKFPTVIGRCIDVWMPAGAKILCSNMQHGTLTLWAEVDDSLPQERRTFSTFGTGHLMPDNVPLAFIATVFDGPFVWHVYEQT